MKGFDDIALTWAGQTYTVPATRQMELICRVEAGLIDGKDRQAYQALTQPSGPPLALMARVYADALAYAGAKVPGIEVYRALTASVTGGDGNLYGAVINDLLKVLGLLASDEQDAGEGQGEKKPEATAPQKAD